MPAPVPGATPPGAAEVAPRKALCTPSIRVIGENRPIQGDGAGGVLDVGDGLEGGDRAVGDDEDGDHGRDAEAAARGDGGDDQPMPAKSSESRATETSPSANPLVWSAKSSLARSAPT